MTIVATHHGPGTTAQPTEGRTPPTLTDLSQADPAVLARDLQAAIDHHRAELAKLLSTRTHHAVALHAANVPFAAIGRLYKLTRERARQLVVSALAAGGGEGVA